MEKLEAISDQDPKVVELLKGLRAEDWNAFPLGWEQITEEQLARSLFGTYTPQYYQPRQMHRNHPHNTAITTHAVCLFFHDGTGVAVETLSHEGKINYYKFGCQHDYKEVPHRGFYCDHKFECKNCGHTQIVDSSD